MSALDQKKIGQRVRELRESMGMDQDVLAAKVKLSQSYVSMIETGAVMPSLKALDKIAKGLGVTNHKHFLPNDDETNLPIESFMRLMTPDDREFFMKHPEKIRGFVTLAREFSEEGITADDLKAIANLLRGRRK